MTDQQSDLVILGGGSGGYACALRASELGLSVTLIEEAELGGTCLHRGCIPAKELLETAAVVRAVTVSVGVALALLASAAPAANAASSSRSALYQS